MDRPPSRINVWLLTGALIGALAVGCGAFGAHVLQGALERAAGKGELSEQQVAKRLANWETAARYQMYHALALLAVGFLAQRGDTRIAHLAGIVFTVGTLIFSGSLYALALSSQRWLGGVVPIGGVLLIIGWMLLAVAAARECSAETLPTP